MALGFEQAIAEYLNSKGFGGLYNVETSPYARVIWVQHRPPAPTADPAEPGVVAAAPYTIAVFVESMPQVHRGLVEKHRVVIECRHASYEQAMQKARDVHALLHENGGQSNGANPQATGRFGDVRVCWIRALGLPQAIGRDPNEEGGKVVVSQEFEAMTKPITLS